MEKRKIILLAETGSDIPSDMAKHYGIELVPMHVAFGDVTRADGSFAPEEIYDFYKRTGKLPKTSAAMPWDFTQAFDRIHKEHPEAHILHLAYSSVTTGSYQNALSAARGRDYVTSIDTRHVTVGQTAVVETVARKLQEHPEADIGQAVSWAEETIARTRMCFLPDDLDYLRAGGRVSNAAYIGARLLSLHPVIELLEGKLVATRKYRGKMEKLAGRYVRDYAESYQLDRKKLWMVYTAGLDDSVKKAVEEAAGSMGFETVQWILANGVITTHGGPGAFGLAGLQKEM